MDKDKISAVKKTMYGREHKNSSGTAYNLKSRATRVARANMLLDEMLKNTRLELRAPTIASIAREKHVSRQALHNVMFGPDGKYRAEGPLRGHVSIDNKGHRPVPLDKVGEDIINSLNPPTICKYSDEHLKVIEGLINHYRIEPDVFIKKLKEAFDEYGLFESK